MVGAGHTVFLKNAVPLMAVIGRLDQRKCEIAERTLVVGQFKLGWKRMTAGDGVYGHEVVHVVAHEIGLRLVEIAAGSTARKHEKRGQHQDPSAPIGRLYRPL